MDWSTFMKKPLIFTGLCLSLSLTLILSSCATTQPVQTELSTAVTTELTIPSETIPPEPAKLLSVKVCMNPSADPANIEDPAAELNENLKDLKQPSTAGLALYSDLYRAVLQHVDTFDLTPYDLSYEEKVLICDLLYGESSFRLSYLQHVYCPEGGSEVIFTYLPYDEAQIALRQETFSARLGQILYNVVPEDGTDLQKYAALYQYICETSNYAPNITDPTLMGPDSILINKVGICWGFSQFMTYLMPQFGLEGYYVSNGAHAWNQIIIDGQRYHSDVTFGTGAYESVTNSFETFLMDDTERDKTLEDAAVELTNVFLGYGTEPEDQAPACTSDRFAVYGQIHDNYTLDIPNNRVYVYDSGGIKTMDLDGSHLITVAKKNTISAVVFNGQCYYLSLDSGYLYRLTADGKAELIDGEAAYNVMKLQDATIYYSVSWEGENPNTYRLIPGREEIEAGYAVETLPAQDMSRSETFYFEVMFDHPMDTSADWSQLAVLTNDAGDPLATRLMWDESGTTLTVRPSYSVDEYKSVSLYILAGAPTKEGGTLATGNCLPVNIHSVADQAIVAEQTETSS